MRQAPVFAGTVKNVFFKSRTLILPIFMIQHIKKDRNDHHRDITTAPIFEPWRMMANPEFYVIVE